ncbi:MAG: hypothetical protein ABL961_00185 [Vicinamibacterales bacterium]
MSISPVNTSSQTDALARQIATGIDTNHDGQVSVAEFGNFLRDVLQGKSELVSAPSTGGTPKALGKTALGFTPSFLGFDASRAQSAIGSLKYDAYNLLQTYDPRDPQAMKQAFAILDAMHPGMYELDVQDNLMLTGTSDGYIGARPDNRDSDWTNRNQSWNWSWFGYNTAHPSPTGEVT